MEKSTADFRAMLIQLFAGGKGGAEVGDIVHGAAAGKLAVIPADKSVV